MFFLQKFFVQRSLFWLPKSVQYSANILKLSKILSGTGCLIGGCCFSRQSDEEAILNEGKRNYKETPKEKENESLSIQSNFNENATISESMKRSFESINNVILENNCNFENIAQIPISHKKKKTSGGTLPDDQDDECNASAPTSIEPSKTYIEKTKVEKNKAKKEKAQKQRPNYFVAVKISNEEIHRSLSELQRHILKEDERLKKSMIELKTLHITLMVMNIGDAETHARAMTALKNVHEEHDKEMSQNPLKLKFQGLGHFQNRVLYAKLHMDESYERLHSLAENVKKHFESVSIHSTDSRKGFTPHLTIAKIDFKKKQNRAIKKIDQSLYKDYSEQYFGTQTVASIQLLSMMDPKNETGYYSGNEIFFSAFDPTARRNSFNELLETEEKKRNVKEMINSLLKEKV